MMYPASLTSSTDISTFLGRFHHSTHYLLSTNRKCRSDIHNAFHAKAVPGLLKLVDTQLSKAHNKGLNVTVSRGSLLSDLGCSCYTKGILLAGGLGSSPHIYECLEAKYSNRGIDIHQSVADGA